MFIIEYIFIFILFLILLYLLLFYIQTIYSQAGSFWWKWLHCIYIKNSKSLNINMISRIIKHEAAHCQYLYFSKEQRNNISKNIRNLDIFSELNNLVQMYDNLDDDNANWINIRESEYFSYWISEFNLDYEILIK